MSTQALVKPLGAMERVLISGDLSKLTEQERLDYYKVTCESLGLNPLTKPFDYLHLNGKLVLYAKRDCTDQLRKVHNVSITIVDREHTEGVYVVTAKAKMPDGRTDESVGAVPIVKEVDGKQIPLKPDDKANAFMKAETKAKRRVTLSICGLGMLDESEIDGIDPKHRKPHVEEASAQVAEPDELLNLLAMVDEGRGKEALALAKDKLAAFGQAGVGAYEARVNWMKSKKQEGKIPGAAIKECLRGLYADGVSLNDAAAFDKPEPGQFEEGWISESDPKDDAK